MPNEENGITLLRSVKTRKPLVFIKKKERKSVERMITTPGTKKSKKMKRFPRLHLDRDMKIAEKILHITYNNLARDRIHWEGYDLYKTKLGIMAPTKFALLGQILVEKKIDPALYIKVMCMYGQFSTHTYLPKAPFLASEKALKTFEWVHESLQKKYPIKSDFKESTSSSTDRDIYYSFKNSALMVKDVQKTFKLKRIEATVLLKGELSAWYWAWFISSVQKEMAEELLEWLVFEEKELKKRTMRCTRYYVKHLDVWRNVKELSKKYL